MSTASTASVAMTPVTVSDRWTRYNATVLTICILGWCVRHLRSHHHAARHADPHQRMGNHAGDDGHGDHDLALDRTHRHVRLSSPCRSLWPQAGAHLGDLGLFDLYRPHRLLDRLDHALDLQFVDDARARRWEARRQCG